MRNPLESLKYSRPSKKTVLLVMAVAAITVLCSALISMWLSRAHNFRVPSVGTIHALGVEAYGGDIKVDPNGTQFIDWGTIYAGSLTNRSFYLRSVSNIETTINLTTRNWMFQDSEGNNVTGFLANYTEREHAMNLTWNYTGTPIGPNEEIFVSFTLWSSDSPSFIDYIVDYEVNTFTFEIVITGKES